MSLDRSTVRDGGPDTMLFREWIKSQVAQEPYWFHAIELFPDFITPGWSNPRIDKLPWFGLPDDLTGMRVLDVGCAEGFFSFEAERRGAREIVSIDSFPESIRRFNICRSAVGSRATPFLCNVYDLNPRAFGTFDYVFFFGVLYHLRHPILALEKILSVCTGTMLLQTLTMELADHSDEPFARFYPFGMPSGPADKPLYDPTVFWVPNAACTQALVAHAGFSSPELLSTRKVGAVLRAQAPQRALGQPPDQAKAPWS
jgi:tRNA (mo5U34)-methyltransferase